MARPKNSKSKGSFMNLGLEPFEEKELAALLKKKDISARKVMRSKIREWIRDNRAGNGL